MAYIDNGNVVPFEKIGLIRKFPLVLPNDRHNRGCDNTRTASVNAGIIDGVQISAERPFDEQVMDIRLSFAGSSYERTASLPTVMHLDERATLARAIGSIQRELERDNLGAPSAAVAVNGVPSGTLAAPDHRELRHGDEITVTVSSAKR